MVTFKGIKLNLASRAVRKDQILIGLANKEFELFAFFTRSINKVMTGNMLLEQVRGYNSGMEVNVVDVLLFSLYLNMIIKPCLQNKKRNRKLRFLFLFICSV
jgi:DNA-binding response OmpR family regulator